MLKEIAMGQKFYKQEKARNYKFIYIYFPDLYFYTPLCVFFSFSRFHHQKHNKKNIAPFLSLIVIQLMSCLRLKLTMLRLSRNGWYKTWKKPTRGDQTLLGSLPLAAIPCTVHMMFLVWRTVHWTHQRSDMGKYWWAFFSFHFVFTLQAWALWNHSDKV